MGHRNRTEFIGNLADDPQLGYGGGSGKAYVRFRLGSSYGKEENRKTEWINGVAFGELAEAIAEQFRKGDLIHIEGRQNTQEWTDQQGVKRYTPQCMVDYAAKPVVPKKNGQQGYGQGSQRTNQGYGQQQQRQDHGSIPDEDIPF